MITILPIVSWIIDGIALLWVLQILAKRLESAFSRPLILLQPIGILAAMIGVSALLFA